MMASDKRIEVVRLKVKDLKKGFGNPRKITAKKKEELRNSIAEFGDFGLILVDENDNIIAGNQRVSVLKEEDPETEVLCKRLIGYSKAELRAINIKDNTHAGDWDAEILADWTADLNIDFGIDVAKSKDDRSIDEMDPIRFEKYDYVIIACNNEIDYNELTRNLGIDGAKVNVTKKRKIKARAVWYHDIKAQIVPKLDEDGVEQ